MLQEGLQEVLESKTFKIRIVKKTTNDKTNEAVIEDGVVYLQVSGRSDRQQNSLLIEF
jgi:hypothetical protein